MEDIDVTALSEQIINEIERPMTGTVPMGTSGFLDPGILPSFGDEYHDCGDDVVHFCSGCGNTTAIGRTCSRSVCPRCSPMWCVERADPNLARLQTVCKVMSKTLGASIKKHHIVLSPPKDWYLLSKDPLDRTFDVVKQILKHLQCEGIICYHGWSGRDGDDRGEWKDRLFNHRDWDDDVRPELKRRPHFHAIVASPFVAGGEVTKRIEEETGWVIERIADEDSGKSIPNLQAAARALLYCLSHTSILVNDDGQNNAQIRTFGEHWHGGEDTTQVSVYESTCRNAENAVRRAAPKTLGVAPNNLRCETPVPKDEQSDDTISLTDQYDETEGASTSQTKADGEEMVSCKAPLKHIKHAGEHLSDEEWVSSSRFVDQLSEAFNDWLGQEPHPDNPPPITN